ncbi:hypothetical protein X737_18925 [Mesorhizobium sp. L48C026A00]|nr:hypothetical protein [Mesorhizobium sp.]ESZ18420.1 hypothetical protein X737_18925 [Mesorhizobium sp. L48C026A00]
MSDLEYSQPKAAGLLSAPLRSFKGLLRSDRFWRDLLVLADEPNSSVAA